MDKSKDAPHQATSTDHPDPIARLLMKWHTEGLYPQLRRARTNEGTGAWKCYFFLGVAGNGRLIEGYGDTPLKAVEAARADKDSDVLGSAEESS
jgi:hypothetical protein